MTGPSDLHVRASRKADGPYGGKEAADRVVKADCAGSFRDREIRIDLTPIPRQRLAQIFPTSV